MSLNLAVTNSASGCGNNPIAAYFVGGGNGTDHIDQNWGYAMSGINGGAANSTGFSYGLANLFGTTPNLANPVTAGAPNCSSASSVPNCMATIISNFTPTNVSAKAYGYQMPASTADYDVLFPQWLCNVELPAGLVTMGCQIAP